MFATPEEANADALEMLGVYKELCNSVLALPVLTGRKSEKEKFAGAVATYGRRGIPPTQPKRKRKRKPCRCWACTGNLPRTFWQYL